MDIQPLQSLAGRWPNDTINPDTTANIGIADALRAITEPAVFFKELLSVDQTDVQTITNLATANNMQYQTYSAVPTTYSNQHPPAWIGFIAAASTPHLMHAVTGKVLGYDTTFCLEYVPQSDQENPNTGQDNTIGVTTSSSTYQVTMTKRSIIRVTLPKVFPQMVLDSNKNDKGYTSTIPTTIEPDQLLTLEGEFQSYFDFYAPVGLQVNTLAVLAPNFMQILMDGASNFDVEFYGNELILVTRECIYDPAVMTQALQALEAQLTYLTRLTNSWNYTPLTPPFDLLRYPLVNGSVVKVGKLRIRPATMLVLLAIGFILFGIVLAAL